MNQWDYIEFKDKFVLTVWLDEPIKLGEDNIISKFTFNLPKHLNNGCYQMEWTTESVEQFVDKLNKGLIPLTFDGPRFEFTANPEDIGFNITNIK